MLGAVIPSPVLARLADVYDGPVPTSPHESLAWAGAPERAVPEAPPWVGTIKPIKALRADPSALRGAGADEEEVAGWLEEALRELDDAETESAQKRILDRLSTPIREPLVSMIHKLFGPDPTSDAEGDGRPEPSVPPAAGHSLRPVGRNPQPAQPSGRLTLELSGVPAGRRYLEWDCVRGSYRRDWCAVAEIDPPTPERELPPISSRDPRLRRQLARLGLTAERHRREAEGDALDLTALIELVVDRAAGQAGDARVYETKRRTAHDLGVLVLLDASGSTGATGGSRASGGAGATDATSATGKSAERARVFDEQRLLAARLTAALEELGDRVATYGFYSRGPKAVRFLRVKDFDDRFGHAAQQRLGALTPGGFTRLGAAIRHGAHVLSSRAGTSMMLLVLISDGVPYENGYERRYAAQDTRRALRESVKRGIGCACVSVRAATEEDVLQQVWGDVPHRRLPDAAALERHVQPLFRDALRAAAATGGGQHVSRALTRDG